MMTDGGRGRAARRRAIYAAVLLATTMAGGIGAVPASAQPSAGQRSFDIPAQPLSSALAIFGRQSGLQISVPADLANGRTASAASGTMTAGEALSRLLAGTGLVYRIDGNIVTLARAPQGVAGAVQLGTLRVEGSAGGAGRGSSGEEQAGPVERPYREPAAKAYIARETIDRFRGSNPADILRGTPGVMSGDARNAGSAIDVNIRGMQGMGRVNVTIDGAMNSTTMYQGYQGISNRTFVDPDFIAGVDITKGSDAASRGIAGTVAMRTFEAGDIVKDGNSFGIRAKVETGTNTSDPVAGHLAGYAISNPLGLVQVPSTGYGTATPSPNGLHRPGALDPTQGSASIVAAIKKDNFEVLAGYSYRERGNYHAGAHGPSAKPVSLGQQPFCYSSGVCPPQYLYRDFLTNGGIANYRAGEEVLNTQLKTESFLAKATWKFGDGHALQLGYTRFTSEAGDVLASRLATKGSQWAQQTQTVGAKLDTYTAKYRWEPANNGLVKLKANFWYTDLAGRNPRRAGTKWSAYQPEDFGLPADHRVGNDNVTWGGDISNISTLDTGQGKLTLDYGLSVLSEDTRPSPYSQELEDWLTIRNGKREEAGAYLKAAWQPRDWLTVNTGLRYQHFWSEDRTTQSTGGNYAANDLHGEKLNKGGFSPFAGLVFQPWQSTQIYVNYSNAQRMPSLFEALPGFSSSYNAALKPERSENWEIGTNVVQRDLIGQGDRAMFKLGYFHWDVSDYIAREWHTFDLPDGSYYQSMLTYNIDRAKFAGLELSARYAIGGFEAELAANYYTDVQFCRTASTCDNRSLYADYATNQIPPEYTIGLTASQKLLAEKLTLGGRVAHTGPRAIEHGEVTVAGLSSFIALVGWKPYTLVDLFAEYRISASITAALRVENLTDRYYIDPLSLVSQPSPGRTGYASLTLKF